MAPIACEGGASGSVNCANVVQHVLGAEDECMWLGVFSGDAAERDVVKE